MTASKILDPASSSAPELNDLGLLGLWQTCDQGDESNEVVAPWSRAQSLTVGAVCGIVKVPPS